MKSIAKLSYLRISPRKVRLVANLIRGKDVMRAKAILEFAIKKGSLPLLKLLHSAIAGAKHNFKMEEQNLYISKITVDEGPKLKRVRPRARGQAYPIHKKTSHITIILEEKEGISPLVTSVGTINQVVKDKEKEVLKTSEKEESLKPKFNIDMKQKVKSSEVRGIQRMFRRKAI